MMNTREQQFIARIAELETENQALRARIAELEQQVSKPLGLPPLRLQNRLSPICQTETTETSSQKAGAKTGTRRQLSPSSHHKLTKLLTTPLEDCPHCHGVIENVTTHQQYVEEVIPAQTTVVCYQTQSGYCQTAKDGWKAVTRSKYPHRLIGPRRCCIAAELKHAMGVPYRKVVCST